jgi:hypothetical protein
VEELHGPIVRARGARVARRMSILCQASCA